MTPATSRKITLRVNRICRMTSQTHVPLTEVLLLRRSVIKSLTCSTMHDRTASARFTMAFRRVRIFWAKAFTAGVWQLQSSLLRESTTSCRTELMVSDISLIIDLISASTWDAEHPCFTGIVGGEPHPANTAWRNNFILFLMVSSSFFLGRLQLTGNAPSKTAEIANTTKSFILEFSSWDYFHQKLPLFWFPFDSLSIFFRFRELKFCCGLIRFLKPFSLIARFESYCRDWTDCLYCSNCAVDLCSGFLSHFLDILYKFQPIASQRRFFKTEKLELKSFKCLQRVHQRQ